MKTLSKFLGFSFFVLANFLFMSESEAGWILKNYDTVTGRQTRLVYQLERGEIAPVSLDLSLGNENQMNDYICDLTQAADNQLLYRCQDRVAEVYYYLPLDNN